MVSCHEVPKAAIGIWRPIGYLGKREWGCTLQGRKRYCNCGEVYPKTAKTDYWKNLCHTSWWDLLFQTCQAQIFSKLIYYARLFSIESKRPRGNNAAQIKYLQHQIDKLQAFFNDNLEFYNYYRRGAMSLDEQYFVRGNRDLRLPLESFHFWSIINSPPVKMGRWPLSWPMTCWLYTWERK